MRDTTGDANNDQDIKINRVGNAAPVSHQDSEPVTNHADGVTTRRVDHEQSKPPLQDEMRRIFGGVDAPASLIGMLVALSLVSILGVLLAASLGSIGYQIGASPSLGSEEAKDIAIGGLIAGAIVLFIAYLTGGYTAGRMARYDGGRNGFMTALWTVLLGLLLAGLGAVLGEQYNISDQIHLPNWLFDEDVQTAGLISGLVTLVIMFVGGTLGGKLGERYNHHADEELVALTADRSGSRRPRSRRLSSNDRVTMERDHDR